MHTIFNYFFGNNYPDFSYTSTHILQIVLYML